MKVNKRYNQVIILLIIVNLCAIAQEKKTKPCSSLQAKQFNFWQGNWKAEWKKSSGETVNGTNHVVSILGGCVIEENFNGNPGTNLIGKSFSVYNSHKKLWQQTWVDNQGGYLDFTGKFKNGRMILSMAGKDKKGEKILLRMVYYNISDNSFDWNWEKSTDDGKTWKTNWKIHYTRIEQ